MRGMAAEGGVAGKTVWITGASGGLGEALAYAFGAAGARLILSARRGGELARVAGAVADAGGIARALKMDLADPDSIAAAAAEVARREGRVDILVHNAGQTQRALVADAGIDIYRRLFEVNFFGPLALTRAVLPALAGGGRIVAISSIAAYYSSPYRSGYNASKKALHGLFDAFRAEAHRDGISVLLVVLGSVRTRVSVNALRGDGSRYGRMDPAMAEGMDPAPVARKILRATMGRREEIAIAPLGQRWLMWRKIWFPRRAARAVRLRPRNGDRP